jgi:hypothetical protein
MNAVEALGGIFGFCRCELWTGIKKTCVYFSESGGSVARSASQRRGQRQTFKAKYRPKRVSLGTCRFVAIGWIAPASFPSNAIIHALTFPMDLYFLHRVTDLPQSKVLHGARLTIHHPIHSLILY